VSRVRRRMVPCTLARVSKSSRFMGRGLHRSVWNLVLFVVLPFRGVNAVANWLTVPAALAAVAIPARVSEWVRADLRWLALAGWVVTALLAIAVVRQHFMLKPLRGLSVRPLDPELPQWRSPELVEWAGPGSGPAFRLSAEVANAGAGRKLEVVADDIEGLNVPLNYGPVTLQWDLQVESTRFIPRGTAWKVHIAAGGDGAIAFVGPHHPYARLDSVSDGLRFNLEVREAGTDQVWSFPMRLTFERWGVQWGGALLVRDAARPLLGVVEPGLSGEGDRAAQRGRGRAEGGG